MTVDALITICIPTYRRPSLLSQAILSCIAQSYRPLEIDISDDSPTDDTAKIVQSFTMPEGVTLRYWRNSPGLGQSANVNSLFAGARGTRLVLLHDDDVLLPDAIKALDDAWHRSPNVIAAYGIQQVIRENGEYSPSDTEIHNGHVNRTSQYTGLHYDILVRALWRQFPNNGYLIETAAARAVGYRSAADIGDQCDADFGIRLAEANRGRSFNFIDRMTSQYRLSSNSLRSSDDMGRKLYNELLAVKDFTPAEDEARIELLKKIAAKATVENAINGRRVAALRIFFSGFYPSNHGFVKSLYHISCIAIPRLSLIRRALSRLSSG